MSTQYDGPNIRKLRRCWWFGCDWEETGVNRWQIGVERKCSRCGRFQHYLFIDRNGFGDEPDWRAGRHPNPKTPNDDEIYNACMSYRHDYGLLDRDEQKQVRLSALAWHKAWSKATAANE